jgi:hypothetical protein
LDELSSYNNDARPKLVVGISSGGVLPKGRKVINNESNQESFVAITTTKLIKDAANKISKNST